MNKELYNHIWEKYQQGINHHIANNLYGISSRCHDFYIGNHWRGIGEEEELPSLNFIKPICKYKISNIAQNNMAIVYSPHTEEEKSQQICKLLNEYAAKQWDRLKMDFYMWSLLKNACITGDHYIYFWAKNGENSPELKLSEIHSTNVYFADETNPNINSQQWIIIAERIPVSKVQATARAKGISEEEIMLIQGDEDYSHKGDNQQNTTDPLCTSLLYMELGQGELTFARSVRELVYSPMETIKGLDVYPVVGLRWEERFGTARGVGNVDFLIANQLEVNKTLARRSVMTKRDAYNKIAYDRNKVTNIDELDKAGAKIEVDNLEGNPIDTIIQYLRPAPISQDASNLQNELINLTRALEGASDASVGNVDPTKASGAAIKAARDQAAVPLNEQVQSFKQCIEDIAVIWHRLWRIYAVDGIKILGENSKNYIVSREQLAGLDINIKVDVTPVDPYSRLSQELALERVLEKGYIDFNEYLSLLDNYSTVPKKQLEDLIKTRES